MGISPKTQSIILRIDKDIREHLKNLAVAQEVISELSDSGEEYYEKMAELLAHYLEEKKGYYNIEFTQKRRLSTFVYADSPERAIVIAEQSIDENDYRVGQKSREVHSVYQLDEGFEW